MHLLCAIQHPEHFNHPTFMKFFMLCRPEQIPGFHASLCNTTQLSNLQHGELAHSHSLSLYVKLDNLQSTSTHKTIYHTVINLS